VGGVVSTCPYGMYAIHPEILPIKIQVVWDPVFEQIHKPS